MIRPGISDAKKYFNDYTVIPVSMEIFSDVKTSVEVLKTFMKEGKNVSCWKALKRGKLGTIFIYRL